MPVKKYENDEERKKARRKQLSDYQKRRYANDPEFREKLKKRSQEYWQIIKDFKTNAHK
jgi:hypothetical protein